MVKIKILEIEFSSVSKNLDKDFAHVNGSLL